MFAVSDYGGEFCCAVGNKNYFAVQFHPEKSGRFGLEMLQRFARWDGSVPAKSGAKAIRYAEQETNSLPRRA